MPGTLVEDIKVGKIDFNGNSITALYGGVSKLYAVYRADSHIFVHFADNDAQGANQRAALTPLAMLRSEVEAAIDRLRSANYRLLCKSDEERAKAKAERKAAEHEWRLARVLLMALQGDDTGALAQLTVLRDELNDDRASEIRSWHLFYAALATIVIVLLCWLFSSGWFNHLVHDFGAYTPDYWTAAAIGGLGALFSIALQVRARAVPVDLRKWDNICDAILRVFIGAISAVVLHALFFGGLVSLQIGGASIKAATGIGAEIAWRLVLAFTAGFTERLVADFLGGFTLGRTASSQAQPSAQPSSGAAKTELDVARGSATKPEDHKPTAASVRDIPHDPDIPNRIEVDDFEGAATLIGGKLDPMEGRV